MAKSKKSSAKPAKKAAKAKPVAKVKKAAPATKSAAKKAPAKKVVAKAPAKKAAPAPKKVVAAKKEAPKKEAPKKPVAVVAPKKAEKVEKDEKVEKVAAEKVEKAAPKKVSRMATQLAPPIKTVPVAAPKPAPPQLNIFPVPNQRPIAHKAAKAPSAGDERTRYSEDELKEFEALINRKLDKARDEYKILKETLNRNNDEGTDATSGGNTKVLEDGAETAEKENLSQLAARQQKYITNLENALVRIKNGTYGICSVTGKLIPKERLIAVPHTTQSIEAKMMQHD
jgi:RNA polymerase-binding transcription factor DksA